MGHLTHEGLRGFDEADAPSTLDGAAADAIPGERILLSSRCALELEQPPLPNGPARLVVQGRTAGWILAEGAPLPLEAWRLDTDAASTTEAPTVELRGELLSAPWELVRRNPDRVARDIEHLWTNTGTPEGVHRIGQGTLSLGAGAIVEPGVVVDLRGGPVRLDDGVRAEGPARLVGPLHIASGSIVFGGQVGTSSIGPVCKLRGEIADCVLLGYTNKAHDGYLGHALVGG
jgi:hypothetical protein